MGLGICNYSSNNAPYTWQKRIGRTASQDYAYAVQQHVTFTNVTTPWYTVAGYTNWTSGAGGYDAWVAKLDENGDIGPDGTWQKTYGSAGDDYAKALIRTGDGGYVVAGYTNWTGGAGGEDAWIAKLDADGNLGPAFPQTWQKTYGGPNNDQAAAVSETPDGRLVVAGFTESFGDAGREFFVLNLDAQGELNACALGASSNFQAHPSSLTVSNASLPAGLSSITMTSPVPSTGITTVTPAYHCDLPVTPTPTPTMTPTPEPNSYLLWTKIVNTPTPTPTRTPTPTPDYCASTSQGPGNEWISRVQIATGDQRSSYSMYTYVPGVFTTVTRGAAYTLTVTGTVYNPGGYTWIEYVNAWIDFNGDRDFADAGETITLGSHTFTATGDYAYAHTVPVPAASAVGQTRMRVIIQYGNPPLACGTYDFGETEDYTLTIAP